MALGLREGVDPNALYDVITHSAGNSWMFENRVPHILSGDYTPLSAVDIFREGSRPGSRHCPHDEIPSAPFGDSSPDVHGRLDCWLWSRRRLGSHQDLPRYYTATEAGSVTTSPRFRLLSFHY